MPAYKIEEKSKPTFIVFDIKDFYPSISKYFLQKALEFVKIKKSRIAFAIIIVESKNMTNQ